MPASAKGGPLFHSPLASSTARGRERKRRQEKKREENAVLTVSHQPRHVADNGELQRVNRVVGAHHLFEVAGTVVAWLGAVLGFMWPGNRKAPEEETKRGPVGWGGEVDGAVNN